MYFIFLQRHNSEKVLNDLNIYYIYIPHNFPNSERFDSLNHINIYPSENYVNEMSNVFLFLSGNFIFFLLNKNFGSKYYYI